MRVLHILEATGGGTRRHILDLLPALQARGIRCDLIYSLLRNSQFAQDAACLEKLGVGVHEIPMERGWGGRCDAAAVRGIYQHLGSHEYNLIHLHSTKAGILGRLAQPFAARRTPLVYTPHCLAFDTALPYRPRRAARLLEKLLAPCTDHFIAVSRHEQRVMLRANLCRRERASVIHNGLDITAFDALLQSPLRHRTTAPPGFIIGSFGRLTRQKNQSALLHALPIIRRAVPDARLLLVGGGEDEAALRRLAEYYRIDKDVLWTGELAEARHLYAHCDVIAQPSRWEGCPYSILEAMAARRPVLSSAAGGVPELLNGCQRNRAGIICAPCRPQDLAHEITALAADAAARQRLGEIARQRVEEEFPLAAMVDKTVAVYQSLQKRRSTPPA
ncbi:MAG TPA: glycosyltransferase [Abditibacteriaceae bacterium]|nr:glycosyltransferase [Abditibacteriaceae bacterium]